MMEDSNQDFETNHDPISETQGIASPEVDDIFCEEEPIHIPGSIKPDGVLLVLEEQHLRILQISNNTREFLGIPPEELLNKNLKALLSLRQIREIKKCLLRDFNTANPFKISFKQAKRTLLFDGTIHRYNDVVILELEPTSSKNKPYFLDFHHLVKPTIDQIQKASTTKQLCNTIVQEVRKLTEFDRVMLYQFDESGAGTVIAEDKLESLEPYLGLRFPATDIPNQARRLFALNKVRVIPDVNYKPVEIIPINHPIMGGPLDLSLSILRSVSPIHIEYLTNMGVAATMTIALTKNQQLWGLIACHHTSPKYMSYEIRTACEFLGQIISLGLYTQQENDELDNKIKLNTIQSHLIKSVSIGNNLFDSLLDNSSQLLDLVEASGGAICFGDEIIAIGKTLDLADIKDLLKWIETTVQDNIFSTDCLPKIYPSAEKFKAVASGLLVLTISKMQHLYLLWFRPEVIQTVSWAGNPGDNYKADEFGRMSLYPRHSFELWKETVRGRSLPWKTIELETVQEFRSVFVETILRQADELAKINRELEKSNTELDSFAYIASHDLKEPLRGIHNYANFLMEDYADILKEDGVKKLQTLIYLSQRMEGLINSLLHYSRLGRLELVRQPTNLNELVQQVIAILKMSKPESLVEFRLPRPLPTISCDRTQMSEVFTNLISNAIKYNNNREKWVEIGFLERNEQMKTKLPINPLTFYIRDNGIGIPKQYHHRIFEIFRRLHNRDDFGGGTGAGLTIARKILERHGGEIWLESTPEQGTTFYFTVATEVAIL